MKKVQRWAALVGITMFAGLSIGADGCFDWGMQDSTSPKGISQNECCADGSQFYDCVVQVQLTTVSIGADMGATSVRCYTPEPNCSSSQADAEKGAKQMAVATYFRYNQTAVTLQSMQCRPAGNCQKSGGSGLKPQDYPGTCNRIVVADAGCTDIAASCTADGDCCSGVCSESGACEACRAVSEGCTANADCCSGVCSLNACGGSGLHLHDGGTGFNGSGGGSP